VKKIIHQHKGASPTIMTGFAEHYKSRKRSELPFLQVWYLPSFSYRKSNKEKSPLKKIDFEQFVKVG